MNSGNINDRVDILEINNEIERFEFENKCDRTIEKCHLEREMVKCRTYDNRTISHNFRPSKLLATCGHYK